MASKTQTAIMISKSGNEIQFPIVFLEPFLSKYFGVSFDLPLSHSSILKIHRTKIFERPKKDVTIDYSSLIFFCGTILVLFTSFGAYTKYLFTFVCTKHISSFCQ